MDCRCNMSYTKKYGVRLMPDYKDEWENFWGEAEVTHERKSGKFWTKPVSSEVFFRDWLKNPLFPRQQKIVSAAFNKDYTMLSDKFVEFIFAGGKGCLHKDTPIKNEKTGQIKTVKEWAELKKPIHIRTFYKTEKDKNNVAHNTTKIVKINAPFKAGNTELFKVTLKSGKEVIVSKEHLFKTKDGWSSLGDLTVGDKILTNSKPPMSKKTELSRRKKISQNMKGKPKTEEHAKNIREAENSGRFKLGLDVWNKGIPWSKSMKERISKKLKGIKLSDITRKRMSEAHKGLRGHKLNCQCSACKARRGEQFVNIVTYKNIKMRSTWEAKFAEYLDKEGLHWKYEPKQFKLSDGSIYIPDFYIIEFNKWVEIKGFLWKKSKQKMDLFKKEYDVHFELLRKEDLQRLGIL